MLLASKPEYHYGNSNRVLKLKGMSLWKRHAYLVLCFLADALDMAFSIFRFKCNGRSMLVSLFSISYHWNTDILQPSDVNEPSNEETEGLVQEKAFSRNVGACSLLGHQEHSCKIPFAV